MNDALKNIVSAFYSDPKEVPYGRQIEIVLRYMTVCLVISTETTMYSVLKTWNDVGLEPKLYRYFLYFLLVYWIVYFIFVKKKNPSVRQLKNGVILGIIFLLYVIATHYSFASCISGLCIPVCLFFVVGALQDDTRILKDYMEAFVNIIFIVSCISLLFLILGSWTGLIPGSVIKFYNYNYANTGRTWFYLFFQNDWQSKTILGHTFYRNVGIFMEAPWYAFDLLICLYWSLFHEGVKIKPLIFSLTLLSTMCSTALLFLPCIWLYYILQIRKIRIQKKILLYGLEAGLIFALTVICIKMQSKFGNDSVIHRFDDYIAGIRTWIQAPVFGKGFYNLEAFYDNYLVTDAGGVGSAGLFNQLAFGGLYIVALFVYGLYGLYCRMKEEDPAILGFLVLILALSLVEPDQYSHFIYLLAGFGIAWKNLYGDLKEMFFKCRKYLKRFRKKFKKTRKRKIL